MHITGIKDPASGYFFPYKQQVSVENLKDIYKQKQFAENKCLY
jgi:hypothetical protein